MACKVTFNSSLGIIESTYTGRVTMDDVKDAINQRKLLTKDMDFEKILVDGAGVTELPLGVMDAFSVPNDLWEKGINRLSRMALVIPKIKKAKELARFFEDACYNRGWKVKCFEERQDAIDWLQT